MRGGGEYEGEGEKKERERVGRGVRYIGKEKNSG